MMYRATFPRPYPYRLHLTKISLPPIRSYISYRTNLNILNEPNITPSHSYSHSHSHSNTQQTHTTVANIKRTKTFTSGHWIPPQPLFPIAISQCHPGRRYTPTDPTSRPQDLFNLQPNPSRLVHHKDPTQVLILTHGIPGKRQRKSIPATPGGIGVYFSLNENISHELHTHPSMIGRINPDGEPMCQTYHSAQILAMIEGLGVRDWGKEGWKRVVIGTCWTYAVEAISGKALVWEEQGWKGKDGVTIRYRELWGEFLGLLERLSKQGVDVKFWDIMKEDNSAVGLAVEARDHKKIKEAMERGERRFEKRIRRERDQEGRLTDPPSQRVRGRY